MPTGTDRRVTVIGNGPAGVAAALAAARAGARVTLIGESEIGGRAGWDSLLPSKVWLAAVERTPPRDVGSAPGGATSAAQVDSRRVLEEIRRVAAGWARQQEALLRSHQVQLLTGLAQPRGPHLVTVATDAQHGEATAQVEGDALILAPGSVPVFPEGMKPDGATVIAPRFASRLREIPARVAVIGAGPTGTEFAFLFHRLGSRVSWLADTHGVLPGMHSDAVAELTDTLVRSGLEIRAGAAAERIERSDDAVTVHLQDGSTVAADLAFVAVGRVPDLARLGDLGGEMMHRPGPDPVRPDGPSSTVDGFGRTATAGVYLVGDAAGAPMLANDAESLAVAAGRHAAGRATDPHRPEAVVHAVYTDPALAQVGSVADDAPGVRSARVPFTETLTTWLHDRDGVDGSGPPAGFLTLYADSGTNRITGAVAVGHHAPDALGPVAVAIAAGATVAELAAAGPAYPTVSELATLAARRLLESPNRLPLGG